MSAIDVSVVIPARNEESYIAAALASVAAQDYALDRIECVVVDNGSEDGTGAAARAYAAAHPELDIVVVGEPAAGIGRAKNRGGGAARGRVLIFLDADSRMAPSLVRMVIASHEAGDPAGSIRIVADSTDLLERGFFALMEVGKVLFGVRAQMMYCDRSLFLSLGGFRPELRQAEDLEFLRRVAERLREGGQGRVTHIRRSVIATSPRRLRGGRFRGRLIATFARWLLAFLGIGRKWEY